MDRSPLTVFTGHLLDMGFTSVGVSPNGHQHRFTRGAAQIDVLIPRHLGERGESRPGATGSPTIAAPGSQQALDRAERVELEVAGVRGAVLRPNLLGALVGKASAMQIVADPGRDRHLEDFAVLASMLTSRDLREPMARLDCDRLGNMVAKVSESGLAEQIPGAVRGLGALRVALRRYSN